jgi:hypothetical protein
VRLQSHVWVSAFLKTEASAGGFPAVMRRGSPEAGVIFVVQEHEDGGVTVFAPAPQALSGETPIGGRSFERALEKVSREDAMEWLDRQVRFDRDCWIVGTERRDGPPPMVVGH